MALLSNMVGSLLERRLIQSSGSDKREIEVLCQDLLGNHGEDTYRTLAHCIFEKYVNLNDKQKLSFFTYLNDELGLDDVHAKNALAAYTKTSDHSNYLAFIRSAEPKRTELFRRLNALDTGTEKLVAMRKDLLRLARKTPILMRVDVDLRRLFASWFNQGFLVLKPITWESPAHILEKIIEYEAVHAINSWDELRARLEPLDRRCFSFFHPAMPNEPLIFVEVALTAGIPSSIQNVLSDGRTSIDPLGADTATFYSISNCQAGLAGISFGNSLIKTVVGELSKELTGLKQFVTLSPLPSFFKWVHKKDVLKQVVDEKNLLQRAAQYLLLEKRDNGMPLDPVARFHLGNGALIHDIHANADLSENGLNQSGGVMVNYLYDLKKVAFNHDAFSEKKTIAHTKKVGNLAEAGRKLDL
jgi:malonyl-CoA decarboxylase